MHEKAWQKSASIKVSWPQNRLLQGLWEKVERTPRGTKAIRTRGGNHGKASFTIFMDDHVAFFTDFDTAYKFLHGEYNPTTAFGPVYLNSKKRLIITGTLDWSALRD